MNEPARRANNSSGLPPGLGRLKLLLSIAGVIVVALIVAVFLWMQARGERSIARNHEMAEKKLAAILHASAEYSIFYGGYPRELPALSPTADERIKECEAAGLTPPELAPTLELRGYHLDYQPGEEKARALKDCPAPAKEFQLIARPRTFGKTALRSYAASADGKVHFTEEDRAATGGDPVAFTVELVAAANPKNPINQTRDAIEPRRYWEKTPIQNFRTLRHGARVFALAFSRNARYLASSGEDERIRVWNVSNGKEVLVLNFGPFITEMTFSPDSKMLAASSEGATQIWEVPSGALLLTLEGSISLQPFSRDSKTIAVRRELWDIDSGGKIREFPGGPAAFSPNGQQAAIPNTFGDSEKGASILDVKSGREIRPVKTRVAPDDLDDHPRSLNFSPDGSRLILEFSTELSYEFLIFDLQTASKLQTVGAEALAPITSDAGLLASLQGERSESVDYAITSSTIEFRTLEGEVFRPDALTELDPKPAVVGAFAFTPGRRLLAVSEGNNILLCRVGPRR